VTRPLAAALLAAGALALALGACGAEREGAGGGGTIRATSGEAIFKEAGCAGCHALAAAGSRGGTAPNLDERRPSGEQVRRKVTEGGGGMPSFRGRLSEAQIRAVADYVSQSAGGGAR
jgi:mono/diheme cytochrome c family protein